MGELKEVSSPPCLSAGCPAHPWAGVQASYFWLEDPVAALPTPQSLANRQWPWVVVVAAAAAAGALDLPHHSSTPRQNEPSSVSSSSDSEVVVSGAEMFELG